MNIVMVGNRTFPVIKAAIELAELLATFDREKDTIHSRGSHGTDEFIIEAAKVMGFQTKTWPGKGGADNFIRDVEMVKAADIVYAFFEADSVGEGGTQHVLDKALDQRKPIRSYTFDHRLILVGSSDAGEDHGGPTEDPADGLSALSGEEAEERTGSGGEVSESRRGRPSWSSGQSR
jgi:hypothetical protein